MSQSCRTCRDRKIRCDGGLPTCFNCSRAHRQCIRLDFRLSWPRDGDRRRKIVYDPSIVNQHRHEHKSSKGLSFVNVSSSDVRLGEEIPRSREVTEPFRSQLPNAIELWNTEYYTAKHLTDAPVPIPKTVSLKMFSEWERPRMHYYLVEGSSFFDSHQGSVLAPLMLKLAVSDDTTASRAVLHAIWALSCSHLGQHEDGFAHRDAANALLSSSITSGGATNVAFKNIATSMLLCMFEIYLGSETVVNWGVYLCGVKQIVQDALTETITADQDYIAIKDWLYYYEVLARFGVMHWSATPEKYPICYVGPASMLIRIDADASSSGDMSPIGYCISVFESISTFTDLLIPFFVSQWSSFEHHRRVREVESTLRSSKIKLELEIQSCVNDEHYQVIRIQQLYLLAALIYLNKAALQYCGEEQYHRNLVEEALSMLSHIEIWEAPWAYFIIGCEAQTDLQRGEILQRAALLESRGLPVNNVWTLRLVEAFWNQYDLDTEQDLRYTDRMTAVISESPFLPVWT